MEEKIANYMKKLGLTRDEAIQLIADDEAIDKGEKLFELTAEQKKVAKKYTKTTSVEKKAENPVKKVRNTKENPEKLEIIAKIAELMGENAENVQIVKAEREISFNIGENSYSLTLTCHRKAK